MRLVALVVVAGCGRIGFDPAGGQGSGDGGGNRADATTACVSDGFCSPTCGAADPDCQTTCGDGTCVGNAGELCTTCASDCRTTANVCGNGTCGPGEDGTTCYSDCGPSPWTWAQDELDLLTAINQARTGGTTCPGGTGSTTAPALTMSPSFRTAARDIAWEQAHLGVAGINRCDGQGLIPWALSTGASTFDISTGPSTNPQRIMFLVGDMNHCMNLMNPSFTTVGIGLAVDSTSEISLFYK